MASEKSFWRADARGPGAVGMGGAEAGEGEREGSVGCSTSILISLRCGVER